MSVITTVPNVSYYAFTKQNEKIIVNNPSDYPDPSILEYVEEPYIRAQIITKSDFIGSVMTLCVEKRGLLKNQVYLTTDRVELTFEMPLAEIVFDFYDRLKSISKGEITAIAKPINLGKTIQLEPGKQTAITEFDEFIVIGKLKSPVSKVSFCYLKNNSELDIEALGIGGVICKCKSKDNCNDQLLKKKN